MLRQRSFDPGDEILTIRLIIRVLKLAAAAVRKVAAWRHLVMRTGYERPVLEQSIAGHSEGNMLATGGDAVPARGDANDRVTHSEGRELAEWLR